MQRHAPRPPQYQATTTTEHSHSDTHHINSPPSQKNCSGPSFILSGDFLPPIFRSQSMLIARDVVNYVCRHEHAVPPPSTTAIIMRNLVDDTLKNRLEMMSHLVSKLDVRERGDLSLVDNIATSMFDDELVNWGRIVTFCSFCGYLARHCEQRCIPDCADEISKVLGDIIINRLGLWIVANGGWVGFEKQFPAVVMWDSAGMIKGLVIIVILVGTILAFWSSIRYINS